MSDVWSSLGGDLKPSVDLVITIAIQPDTLYEIAQAVMAPMRCGPSGTPPTTSRTTSGTSATRTPVAESDGRAGAGSGPRRQQARARPPVAETRERPDADGRPEERRSGDPDRCQRRIARPRWSPRPPTCWPASGSSRRRVRALVAQRRRDDPSPEDPFRGLYLSDEHVDRLLRRRAGVAVDRVG